MKFWMVEEETADKFLSTAVNVVDEFLFTVVNTVDELWSIAFVLREMLVCVVVNISGGQ